LSDDVRPNLGRDSDSPDKLLVRWSLKQTRVRIRGSPMRPQVLVRVEWVASVRGVVIYEPDPSFYRS
jgi:hypothetical protein